MRGKNFSKVEDQIIKDLWPNVDAIMEVLPRSAYSIKTRARDRFELRLPRGVNRRKPVKNPRQMGYVYPALLEDIFAEARRQGLPTRNHLAKAAGLNNLGIYPGRENPTLDTLNALCAALHCQLVLAPLPEKSHAPNPD